MSKTRFPRASASPRGANRHRPGGAFFETTVLAHVTADLPIAREETFGPVAPLFRFEIEQEAIHGTAHEPQMAP